MSTFRFYKYQGTGNDFIMIDNRDLKFPIVQDKIAALCARGKSIGADGLILLQNLSGYDFEMIYFNSDGRQSSMCGNGGRCIVAFAKMLGLIDDKATFRAIDGDHEASVEENNVVRLKMKDVAKVELSEDFAFIDTGSPHCVKEVATLAAYDVYKEGKAIRNSDRFVKEGTNVNFIEQEGQVINVRTYERGVENETLSCGTGVTAVALYAASKGIAEQACFLKTPGGNLKVTFEKNGNGGFQNIWLEGPTEMVFKGEVNVN